MIAMVKKFIGLSAVVCLGAAPAVFANETEGTPAQLQSPSQAQVQSPSQLQTPAQGLNAQQQQQLQKAVAVIVKVPKNQSGQELPLQSQIKLRVSDMAQQGNTAKDLEAIWNEETVDVPADLSQEDNSNSSDEANLEIRRFGWGAYPFARWGFGPRPYFYSYPSFNYYYYPRVGFYPYAPGGYYPYGRRCGWGYRC